MNTQTKDRPAQVRETINAMILAMRMHHRIVERRIDGLGVHHSQHRMLMTLSRMGRAVSQREIADRLDVSPACVARTVKQLSAGGLIEKAGGADGRCNEIALRPEGEALVADSLEVFRRIDEEMFAGFAPEELDRLAALMDRVRDNLAAMEKTDWKGSEETR